MSKKELSNLLKALLQGLKELDESQYQQLLEGKGRIQFIGLESRAIDKDKKGRRAYGHIYSDEELKISINQLRACRTREEAWTLLRGKYSILTRDNLAQLSRLLGVYTKKSDKRESIEEKIVESVVGTKLRSEAIRGLNLKGTRRNG